MYLFVTVPIVCPVPTELGQPPADRALPGRQVSGHRHPPGRDQEGPAGAGPAGGPGEVLPRAAPGGAADQGHLRGPLHPGPGEGWGRGGYLFSRRKVSVGLVFSVN